MTHGTSLPDEPQAVTDQDGPARHRLMLALIMHADDLVHGRARESWEGLTDYDQDRLLSHAAAVWAAVAPTSELAASAFLPPSPKVEEEDALLAELVNVIPSVRVDSHVAQWPKDEQDFFRNGDWVDFTDRGEKLDMMRRTKVARAVLEVLRARGPMLPGREDLIEAMSAALHVTTDRIPGLNPGPLLCADAASVSVAADAVLSLLHGRSAVEALADAWDEGAAVARMEDRGTDYITPNPYR